MKTKNQQPAVAPSTATPSPSPNPQPSPPPKSPPKKSHKKLIIILVLIFAVLALLFFLIVAPFLSLIPRPGVWLQMLLERGKTTSQDDQGYAKTLEAKVEGAKAEVLIPEGAITGKTKPKLAAAEASLWPDKIIGGLYALEISAQEFKRGLIFRITLDQKPTGNFSLGYWHPDTKKWEWLPTVDRGNNVYETILTHASYVGGGQPDDFDFQFIDVENQQMYQEFSAEMSKIAVDQQTGEAAQYNDASWTKAHAIASELTNKVVQDYCDEQIPSTAYDLFTAWQMMQFFPFPDLAIKIERAMENECKEQEDPTQAYIVRQTDTYKQAFSVNIPDFFSMGSQGQSLVFSDGFPVGKAESGKPAWRTGWRIYQTVSTSADINGLIHKEGRSLDSYLLLDIPLKNAKSTSTDLIAVDFSLAGVKEGESFPVQMTRIADYQQKLSGPKQKAVYIYKTPGGGWSWSGIVDPNSQETIGAGKEWAATAILTRDNGAKGAVITFDNSSAMQEYTEATKKAREMAQQEGVPEALRNLYDESGAFNPNGIAQLTAEEAKPLYIIPASSLSQNDQNGDGLPDLVPLVPENSNDQDGDGLPDVVPLVPDSSTGTQNSNDLDGDGLPDPVPLTPNSNDADGDGLPDVVPLVPGN